VTWTRTDALVLGQVQGPNGTDLALTWEWWQQGRARIATGNLRGEDGAGAV